MIAVIEITQPIAVAPEFVPFQNEETEDERGFRLYAQALEDEGLPAHWADAYTGKPSGDEILTEW